MAGGNRNPNAGTYGSGVRAEQLKVRVPPLARDCYEYLARRDGLTLSAWLANAAREYALAQGGDPDRGAP